MSLASPLDFPGEASARSWRDKATAPGELRTRPDGLLQILETRCGVAARIMRALEEHPDVGGTTIAIDIHPSTTNFNKQFRDIDEIIFGTNRASAAQYISRSTEAFRTPFFHALRRLIMATNKGASFIQRLMNISPVDAKALHAALRDDATEDPA